MGLVICASCGGNAAFYLTCFGGFKIPLCSSFRNDLKNGHKFTDDVFEAISHQHVCECGKQWSE